MITMVDKEGHLATCYSLAGSGGSSRFINNSFLYSYPWRHMIPACHNSELFSSFVNSSQGLGYSATWQLDLITLSLDDPSDPP